MTEKELRTQQDLKDAKTKELDEDVARTPKTILSTKYLGPGLVLAMTGIGTSHLVLAPVAGAEYGYALMWILPLAYLLKWQGFELAMRYTAATGESVVDGYERMPGPRRWAVWLIAISAITLGVAGMAGMVSAAATVLWAIWGGIPLVAYAAVISVLAIATLIGGRYAGLELVVKILVILLVIVVIVVYLLVGFHGEAFVHYVTPAIPAGSVLMVSSLFGLLPTSIDLSVWSSLWTQAKLKGMPRVRATLGEEAVRHTPAEYQDYCNKWYRAVLIDFRLGHVMSLILVSIFMILGAEVLRPRGLTPEGAETTLVISRVFTDSVGQWMFPVFIAGAFAALFSTFFASYDGYARAFSAASTKLFRPSAQRAWWSERNAWIGAMGVLFAANMVVIGFVQDPVILVKLWATLTLALSPVVFAMNLYISRKYIPQGKYRPGFWVTTWSIISIVTLIAISGILMYVELVIA